GFKNGLSRYFVFSKTTVTGPGSKLCSRSSVVIMLRVILDKFWNEDVWLPPNTTWEDLAPGPDKAVVYNDYRHLLYPLPLALVLIVLRRTLEEYWFAPFGKSLGIKNTRSKKAPSNPKLENAYQLSPKIKHKQLINNAL
ncbi:hypothetical protein SFRURICE_007527, partial [Spodoptera frugiperda]